MQAPEPKVAIIIVNWNGWRDTIECLRSLEGLTYKHFFVYVVDNGSTDESVRKLEELRIAPVLRSSSATEDGDYELNTVRNKENLGFAGGNNVGIRKALEDGTDYILLLNNDTLVPPDFLGKLAETAESGSRIGIVGPKIYFADDTTGSLAGDRDKFSAEQKIWFGGGKLNWLKTRGSHIDYEVLENPQKLKAKSYKLKAVDYITGCCLLIKREVVEKIGLLSEDYFLYYEDVDWCLKAKKAGFRVAYVPGAYIWHKVSRSAKPGSASYIYYHVRNGLMLSWRYGNTLTRSVLQIFILWTLVKQAVKFVIPSKRMWARACIHGVADFYRGRTGKL